jgi:hypothetical protein
METHHLPHSMGACIGPSAGGHLDFLSQQTAQQIFQLTLDRIVIARKPLPAFILCAIITDVKPQIPHTPSVPLWLPVHYLQKTGIFRSGHKP